LSVDSIVEFTNEDQPGRTTASSATDRDRAPADRAGGGGGARDIRATGGAEPPHGTAPGNAILRN